MRFMGLYKCSSDLGGCSGSGGLRFGVYPHWHGGFRRLPVPFWRSRWSGLYDFEVHIGVLDLWKPSGSLVSPSRIAKYKLGTGLSTAVPQLNMWAVSLVF